MKDSGKKVKNKAKVYIRAKTMFTRENLWIIKNTVLGYIKIQKEKFIKDSGKMIKNKARENSKKSESLKWKDNGKKAL